MTSLICGWRGAPSGNSGLAARLVLAEWAGRARLVEMEAKRAATAVTGVATLVARKEVAMKVAGGRVVASGPFGDPPW